MHVSRITPPPARQNPPRAWAHAAPAPGGPGGAVPSTYFRTRHKSYILNIIGQSIVQDGP